MAAKALKTKTELKLWDALAHAQLVYTQSLASLDAVVLPIRVLIRCRSNGIPLETQTRSAGRRTSALPGGDGPRQ